MQFTYRNHREEIAVRTITPLMIIYEPNPPEEYKYQPGWFLHGYDHEKEAPRTFDINRIIPNESRVLLDIKKLIDEIDALRADRVTLQDENDMLRNEVRQAVAQLQDQLIKEEMDDSSP